MDEDRPRSSERSGRSRRFVLPVALVACLLVGLAAFWGYRSTQRVPKPGQLAVLSHDMIEKTLVARGVPVNEATDPFFAGPVIKKLAGKAAGEPVAKTRALAQVLGKLLATVDVDLSAQNRAPIRTGEELAADLTDEETKVRSVTSYEATVLMAAMLRHAGLQALLCEVHELTAPTREADVSGSMGRYVVAIYAEGQLGKKPILVLDPTRAAKLPAWHGGSDASMKSLAKQIFPLDDASAAARIYALKALQEAKENASEPRRAYELLELAVKASAPSATLHLARAMILAQAGGAAGITDAMDAARKAKALRGDAPRRTILSQLLIAQGKQREAASELEGVLKASANFWPAQQTMGALKMLQGDREGARTHLKVAIKLAPQEPTVMTMHATQLLGDGDTDEAVKLLQRAAALRPKSEQILLQLYMALLKAAEDKKARRVKKRLLAVASDKKRITAILAQIDTSAGVSDDDDDKGLKSPAAKGDASEPSMGFKLPDVKLTPPQGLKKPFQLPDVKLTP